LLAEDLTARQRAAITAVCTDMHRPYLNAVGAVLKLAEIVFDKFHVLQHASAALDEVRRQEFFRAGPAMREHGRGTQGKVMFINVDAQYQAGRAESSKCPMSRPT
jgi:transposase